MDRTFTAILPFLILVSACGCISLGGGNEAATTILKETTTTLKATTTTIKATTLPTTRITTTIEATTTTVPESTTTVLSSTTTSTSTTTTTTFACSGEGAGAMKITAEKGSFGRLYLSFSGIDENLYKDVGLYQGPYSPEDLFMLDGNVYYFDEYDLKTHEGSCNTMTVTIKDVINSDIDRLTLNSYTGPSFILTTDSFDDVSSNYEDFMIEPDEGCNDTNVFVIYNVEGASGVAMLFSDGEIYFVASNTNGTIPDQRIGVWGRNASGNGQAGRDFNDFYEASTKLTLYAFNEGTLDANFDGEGGDVLVILEDGEGELAVIDFYDRSYSSEASSNYKMSVKVMDAGNWDDSFGILDEDEVSAVLKRPDDTLLFLPDSGYRIYADYGSKRRILDTRICPS